MFRQAQRRGVEGGAESRCPHRRTRATRAGLVQSKTPKRRRKETHRQSNPILRLSAMPVQNKSAYYNDTNIYHTCQVCFLQVEAETEQNCRRVRGRRFGSPQVLASISAKPGTKRLLQRGRQPSYPLCLADSSQHLPSSLFLAYENFVLDLFYDSNFVVCPSIECRA